MRERGSHEKLRLENPEPSLSDFGFVDGEVMLARPCLDDRNVAPGLVLDVRRQEDDVVGHIRESPAAEPALGGRSGGLERQDTGDALDGEMLDERVEVVVQALRVASGG